MHVLSVMVLRRTPVLTTKDEVADHGDDAGLHIPNQL